MVKLLQTLFCMLTRWVLSLRYRVTITGMERLRNLRGPTLVLPNHPAMVDPPLVLSTVWRDLQPKPMIYASNFKNPFLYPIMKLLNAVEVPDLDRASKRAREQAQAAVDTLIAGLKRGENHILWPSGRLQRTGEEILGSARALADILNAVPEANIVLVRSRGLWGSMFSYAQTGQGPKLLANLFTGMAYLLANFIFCTPRRPVTLTVEILDRKLLPEIEREKVNRWFENWYNEGHGPATPIYIPYHFLFGPRTFTWPERAGLASVDLTKIKPETRAEVLDLVARKLGRPLSEAEQQPDITLDQLGLDSLDRMDISLRVEQRFGFASEQVPVNLGQLCGLAQGLLSGGKSKPTPPAWFRPPSDEGTLRIDGTTIPEAFVRGALSRRTDIAAADDMSGVLTFERLLVGVVTMARRFRLLKGDHIGLMLPASVASDVAFLALQLVGKTPVLLNWTTGAIHLQHAVDTMGVTDVITSAAFLDRVDLELRGVQFLCLEDLRKDISKWELLRTLLTVRYWPGHIRALVPTLNAHRPAVVLFTSGSEKAPKAVPLTHENILTNQRTGAPFLGLTRKDSVLGFLPAFHSFGLSVTGLLPLLSGMKVVRHPDPTDAGGLARKITAYRPTLLVGTPTFVGYIFDRAQAGQWDCLRLIVVGAEKCPQALFERCRIVAPNARLLEGYGITECSPVVSVNPPDANRPGTIGKPLPGVEVRVVDLETYQVLPANQQGMLLVAGATIFPGYLAYDGDSPFRQLEGKNWYVTGDLVTLDNDGYLLFGGRLKRFLKAGGEMISLPALEEPFARQYPPAKEGPRVAVEGVELENDRRIVLFTTIPMTLIEANALLEREGFRGVMRLNEVRQMDSIPMLGTGKTDYKILRARILAS